MRYEDFFITCLISIFVFISYLPHTISISYIILALLTIYVIYRVVKYKKYLTALTHFKLILITLTLFSLWLLLQPFILHNNYLANFSEIKSQFLVPLLFFFIGILLASFQYKRLSAKILLNIIFFSGFLHILIVTFMAVIIFIQTGTLPIRKVYLVPVDEINYLSGIIYSMYLAEIYGRIIHNKSFLTIHKHILPLIFIIFVFSIYIQGMRWGVVTFSGSTTLFLLILLFKIKISLMKKILIALVFLGILGSMLCANIKYDKRWSTITESINIVLNDKSLYWVNKHKYPCPKLSDGKCVNLSNYLRLAQQINGYKLLIDFPNGSGYSRYAYKNAIQQKYDAGENSFNFPHSSILNLSVGVGFIGITLYFSFLFFVVKFLLKQDDTYPKFFTLFFLFTFHARAVVDSVMMNHNLKIFFLLLGIGLIASISRNKEQNY